MSECVNCHAGLHTHPGVPQTFACERCGFFHGTQDPNTLRLCSVVAEARGETACAGSRLSLTLPESLMEFTLSEWSHRPEEEIERIYDEYLRCATSGEGNGHDRAMIAKWKKGRERGLWV